MGARLLWNPKCKSIQIVVFPYGTALFWWCKTKKNQLFMEMEFRSKTVREACEFQNFLQEVLYSVRI